MTTHKKTPEESLRSLEGGARGLLFPSETDAALIPYRWPAPSGEAPTPEALLETLGLPAATRVAVTTVGELFEGLTTAPKGAAQEERGEAARYRSLVELLGRELSDLRVIRVGTVDIDIYVLGRHSTGEWLGLKTKVVET